ncbi:antitoxin Xre-like helix-turn-helix domain-containing protein [Solitalea lacus]|uniref:type II RES/Xre toxin-antitoxin system antitoxin n=1 Tax=Solitalea lacus TaxID=2911172 RepID=UPI001ED9F2E6|nr:antitoxin Xre-like helix-turn-helix domain-containing protein [Solitalea lacus]UKJ06986.1 MbcA/ParS/Xre antitoxin family protein [Solitalea lacus]
MSAKRKSVYKLPDDINPSSIVEDALMPYQSLLGNPHAQLRVIREGLPAKALSDIISLSGASQIDIAHMLRMSEKTLRSYIKDSKVLDMGVTEHLIQLFELFDKGIEAIGNLDEFKKWLNSMSVGLAAKPITLLDTLTGIELIKEELIRIEFGALA